MKFFSKFGDLIIRIFSLMGMIIFEIPRIPQHIRNFNEKREERNREKIRRNVSRTPLMEEVPLKSETKIKVHEKELETTSDSENISGSVSSKGIITDYSSKEKENTVLQLQILSAAFLILSIIYIFGYLEFNLYLVIGSLVAVIILYILFKRIKLMYPADFDAYRDFFLMYLVVGVILILISGNSTLMSLFSISLLPSLSIFIYALILVVAMFLIFRMRYHRNYTYGVVVEAGKKTAYVRVDYDIRSNVKPEIYIVENLIGAEDGDLVKLQVEEKLLSTGGNRPLSIIDKMG